MSEERLLLLKMIAEGKLTPEEGNRLLSALDGQATSPNGKATSKSAYELLSMTARDMQKGIQGFGTRAGELLKERQKDLRAQAVVRKVDDADAAPLLGDEDPVEIPRGSGHVHRTAQLVGDELERDAFPADGLDTVALRGSRVAADEPRHEDDHDERFGSSHVR